MLFFLLLFSLEWPAISIHPYLSLILLYEAFNGKQRGTSSSSLAAVRPKWPFLYKGRLGREELVANLPTALLQRLNSRYLCHCEAPHLWSEISCCSWLISCRGAGKAAAQLSQAEQELIFSWVAPSSPGAAGRGPKTRCTLLWPGLSAQAASCPRLALLSVKLVERQEYNTHEVM